MSADGVNSSSAVVTATVTVSADDHPGDHPAGNDHACHHAAEQHDPPLAAGPETASTSPAVGQIPNKGMPQTDNVMYLAFVITGPLVAGAATSVMGLVFRHRSR